MWILGSRVRTPLAAPFIVKELGRSGKILFFVLSQSEIDVCFSGYEYQPTGECGYHNMYGTGLRLMELLRLRVHHLDMERNQLRVHGGKGDKDRVTVLPELLKPKLHVQLDDLRGRFADMQTPNTTQDIKLW